MIRVVIVDDHPAVRSGLETVLSADPELIPVGTAESEMDLWPLLHRTRPDVVILDYHLPGRDGLQLCRRIKADPPAPKVALYSAYARGELAIPATLAGADGVIGKNSTTRELFEAIRSIAAGERVLPPIPRELQEQAAKRLDAEDLPILGMALEQTSRADMQRVLSLDPADLARRIDRMIGRLRVEVPHAGVQ
jgi:DNA-binding NarL/FixJ family response regulator